MEDLAKEGYDVWALDFRGFGKSTMPAAMEKPPHENPPVVRATEAIKDVEAAVEYIRKTRKIDRVNIIGWSWGAVAAGMYAAGHPEKVNKLVLYGAMHGFNLPSMVEPLEERPGALNSKLPAYQLATFEMILHHWHTMMDGHELARKEAFEAVAKVFMESDPTSGSRQPNSIRRPVGPLVDLYYIWSNKPVFDAGKIKAHVLVIRGDADLFADPTLFGKLSGAGWKKEIIIKDATHWVLYERNRSQLISETTLFLKTK
ncbi:MAG: alpha/beta fold hydrolase [Deltaproteobacteria bacterium]|nr:alpha/beta fold hydrolase [Deltaproteobacteria bacterium]